MIRPPMDMPTSSLAAEIPTLVERLLAGAQAWAEANDATLARLGRMVVNDGGYFTRVDTPEASTTTGTLEKFARFFADPGNWPNGEVPAIAAAFVAVVGIPAAEADVA